jgi:hypothetical protein
MQIQSFQYHAGQWTPALDSVAFESQWVLAFGGRVVLGEAIESVRQAFAGALICACSTSGEIAGDEVNEDSVTLTAVRFDATPLRQATARCANVAGSEAAGEALAAQLHGEGLRHVFVLSKGLDMNGTALAHGLQAHLADGVSVSGGMAGDGAHFETTQVYTQDAEGDDLIVAVGFYGDAINVSSDAVGGWQTFGPERVVTQANGSTLIELDGKTALDKYKEYLGEYTGSLPSNALMFPIQITPKGSDRGVVRTVLAIDEAAETMTFAGDIPLGATVQLMRSNTDSLVEGARSAASHTMSQIQQAELAILVSCVGRKLVLKQRVEEEVEAVMDVISQGAVVTGFYSYGELAPAGAGQPCDLHNQTMTVTLFSENP